jgi:hypothetical protein
VFIETRVVSIIRSTATKEVRLVRDECALVFKNFKVYNVIVDMI